MAIHDEQNPVAVVADLTIDVFAGMQTLFTDEVAPFFSAENVMVLLGLLLVLLL